MKNISKILEVGKFSHHYQPFFVSDKTFYSKANNGNSYNYY